MSAPSTAGFDLNQAETVLGGAGKRLLKKGWIWKQGGASGSLFSRDTWKRRWVVLEPKRLIWYENESSLPKGEVFVLGSTVEADPSEMTKQRQVRRPE